MKELDKKYMQRALELAQKGIGEVSPNPMVGCVIVKNQQIIGEGYHQKFGQAHAEVNAVNAVGDPADIVGATVYVTLEPCAHHGKTPPCAELLARVSPKRVVVCNPDPNPLVAGRGMKIIEEAGIETEIGVLAEEGKRLNRRFFAGIKNNRPYVILKWAQTADGFIARENYDSKWISCEASRQAVHVWRAEEDAIMVATNTAMHDNPSLTAREPTGRNPVRVLLDRKLRVPQNFNLYNDEAKTIIFNHDKEQIEGSNVFVTTGIGSEKIDLKLMMKRLYKMKIGSIIIEGGTKLLNQFVEDGLWDETRVFTSSTLFETGIAAPALSDQKLWQTKTVGVDKLEVFLNEKLHADLISK